MYETKVFNLEDKMFEKKNIESYMVLIMMSFVFAEGRSNQIISGVVRVQVFKNWRAVLVWFVFLFKVPVINFSVILGRSHRFLGIYQYFGNLKVSCSRTLYGGRGVRTLDLSLRSPELYHLAIAPPTGEL